MKRLFVKTNIHISIPLIVDNRVLANHYQNGKGHHTWALDEDRLELLEDGEEELVLTLVEDKEDGDEEEGGEDEAVAAVEEVDEWAEEDVDVVEEEEEAGEDEESEEEEDEVEEEKSELAKRKWKIVAASDEGHDGQEWQFQHM